MLILLGVNLPSVITDSILRATRKKVGVRYQGRRLKKSTTEQIVDDLRESPTLAQEEVERIW